MATKRGTRNSLRNAPRLTTQQQQMDIEQPPRNHKSRSRSQRFFGKELSKLLVNSQTPLTASKSNPSPCEEEIFCNPVRMMEETISPRRSEIQIYQRDIQQHLLSLENSFTLRRDFLALQPEIDANIREILIAWLMEVGKEFGLRSETLFKTVSLLDCYLSCELILRGSLQLLGVTCLFISCKFEQVEVHHIKRFVSICAGSATMQEILAMESQILITLGFRLTTVSSLNIMEVKCQELGLDQEILKVAEYLLELSLLKYEMCDYKPSTLGISAVYLAGRILGRSHSWSRSLKEEISKSEGFKTCLRDMYEAYKDRASARSSNQSKKPHNG